MGRRESVIRDREGDKERGKREKDGERERRELIIKVDERVRERWEEKEKNGKKKKKNGM